MAPGEHALTALQRRILVVAGGLNPPARLTGGAALLAVHLGHRSTRDLVLFWRDRDELGGLVEELLALLARAGLPDVRVMTRTPAFARLQVRADGVDALVDLVTEPFSSLRPPVRWMLDGQEILVDDAQEILTNKLTALLSRSEIRDLVDIEALVEDGADLGQALEAAPLRDAGFSAPTLAWVVQQLPLRVLGRREGLTEAHMARLEGTRDALLAQLGARGPAP